MGDSSNPMNDLPITRIDALRLRMPLTHPYENALGRLEAFDVLVFGLSNEADRVGWGEACPVSGYSPETPDQAWRYAQTVLPGLVGKSPTEIAAILATDLDRFPFVVSALHEAIEDLARSPWLHGGGQLPPVELLGTVNTLDREAAPHAALELVEQGYRTLKVKVGYDPDADAARVNSIAAAVAGRARLRVDANQGYGLDQAVEFARRVPAAAIEVFEQPVPADRWDLIEAIGRLRLLPLMLDESIYGPADIERAATLPGVTAIKLKMSKTGGPTGLAEQVILCRQHGLDVVIGNGIASDLGCFHEALCYARLGLPGAAEMNGFLKTTETLLSRPLRLREAQLLLPDPNVTRVDPVRVMRLAVQSLAYC